MISTLTHPGSSLKRSFTAAAMAFNVALMGCASVKNVDDNACTTQEGIQSLNGAFAIMGGQTFSQPCMNANLVLTMIDRLRGSDGSLPPANILIAKHYADKLRDTARSIDANANPAAAKDNAEEMARFERGLVARGLSMEKLDQMVADARAHAEAAERERAAAKAREPVCTGQGILRSCVTPALPASGSAPAPTQ